MTPLPEGFPAVISDEMAARIVSAVLGIGPIAELVKKLETLSDRELAGLLVDHFWAYLPLDTPQSKLLDEVINRLQGPEPWTVSEGGDEPDKPHVC